MSESQTANVSKIQLFLQIVQMVVGGIFALAIIYLIQFPDSKRADKLAEEEMARERVMLSLQILEIKEPADRQLAVDIIREFYGPRSDDLIDVYLRLSIIQAEKKLVTESLEGSGAFSEEREDLLAFCADLPTVIPLLRKRYELDSELLERLQRLRDLEIARSGPGPVANGLSNRISEVEAQLEETNSAISQIEIDRVRASEILQEPC